MIESETQLVQERKSIKASLTRIHSYISKSIAEQHIDIEQINIRNEKLEELWLNYNKVQQKLEFIDEEKYEGDRDSFEERYYTTKALIGKIKLQGQEDSRAHTVSENSTRELNGQEHGRAGPNIRLPQLNLPQFSGNYKEWRSFYDMFTSVIHNNDTIPEIQKLFYLKSSLSGEALQIIEAISSSTENYSVALQLLIDRYNNEQHIINAHLKALFDIPAENRDSVNGLRRIIIETKQHLRSLDSFELPTSQWDAILIYMTTQKLGSATRREWELSKSTESRPTMFELFEFLERRCFALEVINPDEKQQYNRQRSKAVHVAADTRREEYNKPCKLCKGLHHLGNCDQFMKQSLQQRIETIKTSGVCFNCLKPGHGVAQCRAGYCRKCKRKHNTLIHNESTAEPTPPKTETVQIEEAAGGSNSLHNREPNKQILLSTAVILIKDYKGEWQTARALLDSASQSNFMSTRLSERIRCKQSNINVPINGINKIQTNIKRATMVEIKSRITNYIVKLEFLILENITNQLPTNPVNTEDWNLSNITMADPKFDEPNEVDLLIGAELYFELMKQGQIKLGRGLPILQNSKFGWIVSGRVMQSSHHQNLSCYISSNAQFEQQICRFWEIEEVPQERHFSKQEATCEEHFKTTVQRNRDGRYIVTLPFNKDMPEVGDSYNMALQRFHRLEIKLNQNPSLKQKYVEFMREYSKLHHMERMPQDNAVETTTEGYYLPHHAVLKTSSLTTKIRVVFDASAKTSNGISLNDTLLVGPTIQDDVFSLITRFRLHKIVITGDIEKMYRQILIHENDTKYQKILWRENLNEPIETYKLRTVTYGMAPAPFLAIRSLQQLAEDGRASYPLAAEKLSSDFYVDDMLTGADTIEQAESIRDQMIALLTQGGFTMRQWSSNNKDILKPLANISEDPTMVLDTSQSIRTLGLEWNANLDIIKYQVSDNLTEKTITKRLILSQIAKLFDPLGLVGPVLVQAKIVMQQLWQLQVDWDEPLSTTLTEAWLKFTDELRYINNISIIRRIIIDQPVEIQLHAFCDASEQAYGTCIYLRSTDKNNIHESRLICSKSRIAPLKRLTLPRLELCAAVLLTRLFSATQKALNIHIDKCYFWSDSTITLYWINTSAHLLKTFIANRVSEIQKSTEVKGWRHVRSLHNPADVISRGQYPKLLMNNDLWWSGPSWLRHDESTWPNNELFPGSIPAEIAELKVLPQLSHVSVEAINLFQRFSTITKLQRTVAYCLRFVNNANLSNIRENGALTVAELSRALEIIIKLSQQEQFSREIQDLTNKQELNSKSTLKQLYPFLDNKNILRVGGRLQYADIPYEQRHQIILPSGHPLTKMIFRNAHKELLHAGTQAVLSYIRQRYWPIKARTGIKQIIYQCITCFKLKATQQSQLMGMLPKSRVTITRPFLNTGLDYGGPIPIKISRRISAKAYIALFICMATKAIHIELVSSLSTHDFLAAFRRFISRRGKCANIYSDNGTNFKGANKQLIKLYEHLQQQTTQDDIMNASAKDGIQWHFIPPGAPHFGGLWEAGIKTVKSHMKRVIGESILSYEELSTILSQIEACVNSRPLIPESDDPTSLTYLTPAHFLIGDALTALPESDLTTTPENRLTRWQLVQQKRQNFWRSWSYDYLNQLQQRTKWNKVNPNIRIGSMALLKEENLTPMNWKLGRITQLHPGKDGMVRVVTLRTKQGELKRPVTKICLLPIEEEVSKPEFQDGRNVQEPPK